MLPPPLSLPSHLPPLLPEPDDNVTCVLEHERRCRDMCPRCFNGSVQPGTDIVYCATLCALRYQLRVWCYTRAPVLT
eukprot:2560364-Rhodomonas_salina.1